MRKSMQILSVFFFIQLVAPIYAQIGQKPELVVQLGHSGAIYSAIFSPDGKLVASSGEDAIIIWQTTTGREIRRLSGSSPIGFAPDSKTIATNHNPNTQIIDVTNGKVVKQFTTHTQQINSIEFSSDGKLLLTSSDDKTARLWNVSDGSLKQSFDGHKTKVSKAIFSPDNKYIATISGERDYSNDSFNDSIARIWDIESGREIQQFLHEDKKKSRFDGLGDIAFSPDGKYFITSAIQDYIDSNEEKKINIWEVLTGELKQTFRGSGKICLSKDGKYLVADIEKTSDGKYSEGIEVIDINTKEVVNHITNLNLEGKVSYTDLSPNGKYVLIATSTDESGGSTLFKFGENSLVMFDVPSGKKISNLGGKITEFDFQNTNFIKILNNDNLVLAGNHLWNIKDGTQVNLENIDYKTLEKGDLYREPFRTFSKNGKLLAMNSDNVIQVWNTENGKEVQRFEKAALSAWFTPDNQYFLTENLEEICLWSLQDGKKIWSRKIDGYQTNLFNKRVQQDVAFCALSPNGKYTIVRESNDTVTLLETVTGKIIWTKKIDLSEQSPGIYFSPDGKLFIVPVNTEYLEFFDVITQQKIKSVKGEFYEYYVSNSNYLLSGYRNSGKNVVLIDTTNGKALVLKATNPSQNTLDLNWGSWESAVASADGKLYLQSFSAKFSVYEILTGKKIRDFNEIFYDAVFLQNEKFILTVNSQKQIEIWSVITGEKICQLIGFDDGTWTVITADGRFDTNNIESINDLHWVLADDPLDPKPCEIFSRQYYEPGLLQRVLKCTEENSCDKEFKPLPSIADINRVQPKVVIKEIKAAANSTDLVDVTVEIENVTDDVSISATDRTKKKRLASGVFDVRLFRDGQMIGNSTPQDKLEKFYQAAPELIEQNKKYFAETKQLINTPEDEAWRTANNLAEVKGVKFDGKSKYIYIFKNIKLPRDGRKEVEFTAYAFNADRVKSDNVVKTFPIPATLLNKPQPKRAFVVAFGVNKYQSSSWDLQFAANDARAMREILADKLRKTNDYAEVVEIPLISDDETVNGKTLQKRDATKQNVRTVLDLLAGKTPDEKRLKTLTDALGAETVGKIKPANPEDAIFISFSSHGYADLNGIFYILPTDIGAGLPRTVTPGLLKNSISSDELSLWLRDVDAGNMTMIVDACNAEAAVKNSEFKPAPMGSRGLGQLAYDKGMKILTATQAANVAIETGAVGHGLLTYALIGEGLGKENKADFRAADKTINLKEWLEYGEFRVPGLYDDLLNKRLKIVGKGTDVIDLSGDNPKLNSSSQTPVLFDFTKRRQELTLVRLP